jgi:hypothetical protein
MEKLANVDREVGELVYDRQFRLLEHSKRKSQLISEFTWAQEGLVPNAEPSLFLMIRSATAICRIERMRCRVNPFFFETIYLL